MSEKGSPKKEDEQLTIRLVDQNKEEIQFKVKKTTKLSKVFEAYATRKGVDRRSIRFQFDGENVSNEDTPKLLEMEDQDIIQVMLEQLGGKL